MYRLSIIALGCFVLGSAFAADLGGPPSSKNTESNRRVGEQKSPDIDDGHSSTELVPPVLQPLPPSLADEVDSTFGGDRRPGFPGARAQTPRLVPTGIKNQFRVIEDPTGTYKQGSRISCDDNHQNCKTID